MAERYHWTPAEVDALDPDVFTEFAAFWKGESLHKADVEKEAKRNRPVRGRHSRA